MEKIKNLGRKLSKEEQKNIIGGIFQPEGCSGSCDYTYKDNKGRSHTTPGTCTLTEQGLCYCSSGEGSCS